MNPDCSLSGRRQASPVAQRFFLFVDTLASSMQALALCVTLEFVPSFTISTITIPGLRQYQIH
jgi:hypothetical protein